MRAGERAVLRGVSKRAVVVESPEPWIFERAIFIVNEDAALTSKDAGKELMREAEREARLYVASLMPERESRLQTCIRRLISLLRRIMMRFSRRLI